MKQATGWKKMALRCAKWGLDQILGEISSLKSWSDTGLASVELPSLDVFKNHAGVAPGDKA